MTIDSIRYATAPVSVRIKRAQGHLDTLTAELRFSLQPEALASVIKSVEEVRGLLNTFSALESVMVAD